MSAGSGVTGFTCRSCGGVSGELLLDLGEQPLANNLPRPEDDQPEPRFPLRLAVCAECWLLQITDLVPPAELFSEYVYFSSYSDAWVKGFGHMDVPITSYSNSIHINIISRAPTISNDF